MSARICIAVAIDKNRAIGHGNELLWHIPDDLKRFKRLTIGHPLIMGRKTFESIIAFRGKPLPERTNIVLTRELDWQYTGANPENTSVLVAHSLEEALIKAQALDQVEIHIGGGAQLYEQALPFVDKLYLTLIDGEKEGDVFFPEYEKEFTKKVFEEKREWEGVKYTWVDLER